MRRRERKRDRSRAEYSRWIHAGSLEGDRALLRLERQALFELSNGVLLGILDVDPQRSSSLCRLRLPQSFNSSRLGPALATKCVAGAEPDDFVRAVLFRGDCEARQRWCRPFCVISFSAGKEVACSDPRCFIRIIEGRRQPVLHEAVRPQRRWRSKAEVHGVDFLDDALVGSLSC